MLQVSVAWPSSPPLTVIVAPFSTAIVPLIPVITCWPFELVVVGGVVVVVVVVVVVAGGPSSARLSPTRTPFRQYIRTTVPTEKPVAEGEPVPTVQFIVCTAMEPPPSAVIGPTA